MADYSAMSDRELDAAVAEKVMGWKLYDYENGRYAKTKADYVDAYTNDGWGWEGRSGDEYAHQWSPSTDISAAWEVVERVKSAKVRFLILCDAEWCAAEFFAVETGERIGEASLPPKQITRAICLAALAAVEVKEKTNA